MTGALWRRRAAAAEAVAALIAICLLLGVAAQVSASHGGVLLLPRPIRQRLIGAVCARNMEWRDGAGRGAAGRGAAGRGAAG